MPAASRSIREALVSDMLGSQRSMLGSNNAVHSEAYEEQAHEHIDAPEETKTDL